MSLQGVSPDLLSLSLPLTETMGCKKSKPAEGQSGGSFGVKKREPVQPEKTVYVRDPTSPKPHTIVSSESGREKSSHSS